MCRIKNLLKATKTFKVKKFCAEKKIKLELTKFRKSAKQDIKNNKNRKYLKKFQIEKQEKENFKINLRMDRRMIPEQ